MPDLRLNGPERAPLTLALAHGAGAAMDTPFMNQMADGLAAEGLRVARFEFPYMRRRRTDGVRRGPDRPAVLKACWLEVLQQLGDASRVVVGGKSMGGRVASMLADEVGARGLVCLGYPFHPPGRPGKPRIEHLAQLSTPALIVQGTRDLFGTQEEVRGYPLSPTIQLLWLEDGDHSFKPRVRSGRTHGQAMKEAVQAVAAFVKRL